ncbi:MAG: metal ABC transporter substrate-binding protein [Erysipelotrichaceae bacterium]|nr:metal ABC transporter substrate-binding protein [Erysipelotrichaceae bacterium]
MKKTIIILLSVLLLAGSLYGCGEKENKNRDKYSVVVTVYPVYDWLMNVIGEADDSLEVRLLINNGIDLHSYQPSVADIALVSGCDMLIYVGGESEAWVNELLDGKVNEKMKVINLIKELGDTALQEETVEGMQSEEHGHDEEESEIDEHIWLSLKNAMRLVPVIADGLAELDGKNTQRYQENSRDYLDALETLDESYRNMVKNAGHDTLIFADRFPFRYLVEDYGLQYFAAFSGCSAETEASFETIAFLAGKADELDISALLILENGNARIAETIISNSAEKNKKILVIDSMQSVTSAQIRAGISYLKIMENNLNVLRQALQ